MSISETAVRRPVLMIMIYVVILLIALVYIPQMEIALYPNVEIPVISVIITCNDAGPDEIEQQVAKELESTLSSLENLDTIMTYSMEGYCMAILQYEYGTDLDDASEDLNTYITMLSYLLPDWTDSPQTVRMDSFSGSSSAVTLRLTSDNLSLDELSMVAENTVSPLIERVEGVGQVTVSGGNDIEYHVNVDPNRLEAYGLPLASVLAALMADNVQVTGGQITQGSYNYTVAADERYTTVEDIGNTLVATINRVPIRVNDVATIVESYDDSSTSESYYNDERVVTLSVTTSSDANATTVANAVLSRLDEFQDALPSGTYIELQRDSTEMIKTTIGEAVKSLVQGVVLAAIVIFIFLRGIKSTIIIALSMPISVLITMIIMAMFGVSINGMSMAGLILGIGMIVDASIVILENTYSYRLLGEKSAIAAILGSKNMIAAITSSTLTTICVFLPIILYKSQLEMFGIMFQDLVITICASLASSLFVAVTLVPALCGSIMRIDTRTQKPLKSKLLRRVDTAMLNGENALKRGYVRCLAWCLNHKLILVVFLVLLLLVSINLMSTLGFALMPDLSSDDEVELDLELPTGTQIEVTRGYVLDMVETVKSVLPEDCYEALSYTIGGGGLLSSENSGSITIMLPDLTEQTLTATDVQTLIRPYLNEDPNAVWTYSSGLSSLITDIDIEIHSDDTETARTVSDQIKAIMLEHVPGVANIETDADEGQPKVAVHVNRDIAADYGLSPNDVATAVQYAIAGITATEITTFSADQSYDVVVQIDPDTINTVSDLGSILVSTNYGLVRLDTLADLEITTAPVTIMRENRERINHVTASVLPEFSASEVQNSIERALDEYLILPEGVSLDMGGSMDTLIGYIPTIIMVILLALFLVYAVMAAQFESLIDPFIIFVTIPLLLIGVVAIHLAMGETFTLFSIIGVVALLGTVVNNGIVLIDCINRLVNQHVPVRQACLQAAYGRLRPILMSTFTTIFGMVPMAFFPGEGAEMMQPIALTFVGGLITGAFLTLFLSPTLYSLFHANKDKHFDDPESLNNQLREYDMRQVQHLDNIVG